MRLLVRLCLRITSADQKGVVCGGRAAAPLWVSAQFSTLIRQSHGAKIESLANHIRMHLRGCYEVSKGAVVINTSQG